MASTQDPQVVFVTEDEMQERLEVARMRHRQGLPPRGYEGETFEDFLHDDLGEKDDYDPGRD